MPLQRRVPKRGFRSRSHKTYQLVKLADLERKAEANAEIDVAVMRSMGLIKNEKEPVKILADGEITKTLVVRAHAFSQAAREKIENAGGRADSLQCAILPCASASDQADAQARHQFDSFEIIN